MNKSEVLKLIKELFSFLDGRVELTHEEMKKLYLYYNLYYDKSEHNLDCYICFVKIYTKLNKLTNE
jgi:hypothetical protein